MHVLICEDERHLARLLQVNFEKQGWQVSLADTGRKALDLMLKHKPDMLVLDQTLPDMTVEEVHAAIAWCKRYHTGYALGRRFTQ